MAPRMAAIQARPPITPPAMAPVEDFLVLVFVGVLDGVEDEDVLFEVEFDDGEKRVFKFEFPKPVAGAVTVAPPLSLRDLLVFFSIP